RTGVPEQVAAAANHVGRQGTVVRVEQLGADVAIEGTGPVEVVGEAERGALVAYGRIPLPFRQRQTVGVAALAGLRRRGGGEGVPRLGGPEEDGAEHGDEQTIRPHGLQLLAVESGRGPGARHSVALKITQSVWYGSHLEFARISVSQGGGAYHASRTNRRRYRSRGARHRRRPSSPP